MLGRGPRTKETIPNIFVKIWIPIYRTQQCGIGSPEIHRNFVGLEVVNGTPEFGMSHGLFSILYYESDHMLQSLLSIFSIE